MGEWQNATACKVYTVARARGALKTIYARACASCRSVLLPLFSFVDQLTSSDSVPVAGTVRPLVKSLFCVTAGRWWTETKVDGT